MTPFTEIEPSVVPKQFGFLDSVAKAVGTFSLIGTVAVIDLLQPLSVLVTTSVYRPASTALISGCEDVYPPGPLHV